MISKTIAPKTIYNTGLVNIFFNDSIDPAPVPEEAEDAELAAPSIKISFMVFTSNNA